MKVCYHREPQSHSRETQRISEYVQHTFLEILNSFLIQEDNHKNHESD
jgi:hypothetical protein